MLTGYLERLNSLKIILGSKSEPRKQLLTFAGLQFLTADSGFAEDLDKSSFPQPLDYVRATARGKLDAFLAQPQLDFHVLIVCDSVIVFEGSIMEKPGSHEEHQSFMRRLSGKTHECLTCVSVVLRSGERQQQADLHSTTQIEFGPIPEASIFAMSQRYPELLCAAGGYQVQASGGSLVREIRGSSSGLIGLPMCELAQVLVAALDGDFFNLGPQI